MKARKTLSPLSPFFPHSLFLKSNLSCQWAKEFIRNENHKLIYDKPSLLQLAVMGMKARVGMEHVFRKSMLCSWKINYNVICKCRQAVGGAQMAFSVSAGEKTSVNLFSAYQTGMMAR